MAITNYSALVSTVSDYMSRTDLAGVIPSFVRLAEGRFNRDIRAPDMITTYTATLSSSGLQLPGDYLEWMSVVWQGERTVNLRFVRPDSEEWQFRYRPNGDPAFFTIMDEMRIRPYVPGTATLTYYRTISPLEDVSTNWLLTKFPDLYLYATLSEAYAYQKDEERASAYSNLAKREYTAVEQTSDSGKGDREAKVA